MSGFKFTGLGTGTAPTDAATVQNANSVSLCEFRLTLSAGIPVTTSDITGATTIFCSPYKGNRIALYDGTNWNMRSSAEFSIALGTLTSGKPYDVFCFDNAGVPTLELLAWTSGNVRATALVLQNGVLSKTGALTRRYLGTFYTTATTTTEDSYANRYLWNYYNRVARPMRRSEVAASWTYTTNTTRQANGNTANQLNFVYGWQEDPITVAASAGVANTNTGVQVFSGMGLDSTTGVIGNPGNQALLHTAFVNGTLMNRPAMILGASDVSVGQHFVAWLENSAATGTTT